MYSFSIIIGLRRGPVGAETTDFKKVSSEQMLRDRGFLRTNGEVARGTNGEYLEDGCLTGKRGIEPKDGELPTEDKVPMLREMDKRRSDSKVTPRASLMDDERTGGVYALSVTVSDPSESHSRSVRFIRVSRRLELAEKNEEIEEPETSECMARVV